MNNLQVLHAGVNAGAFATSGFSVVTNYQAGGKPYGRHMCVCVCACLWDSVCEASQIVGELVRALRPHTL